MALEETLQDLILQGWQFWQEDDRLRYRAPKSVDVAEVLATLKPRKSEILHLLQDQPDLFQIYPLSLGQRALWFLWQFSPQLNWAYNGAFAFRIHASLKIETWHQIFHYLATRHPLLRSTFPRYKTEPIQRVHREPTLDLQVIEAKTLTESELQQIILSHHRQLFNLETDRVLRIRCFDRGLHEFILLVTIHHIAWDGWSLDHLIQEIFSLYQQSQTQQELWLPPLSSSYQEYVYWQQKLLPSPKGEALKNYWLNQLSGLLPVLNLPTDRPRPPLQTHRGALCLLTIELDLTQALQTFVQTQGTTLYTALLALFQVLLYRYSQQDDILVGSPAAGRSRSEFEPVVGYFVNSIVLRGNFVQENLTFRQLLTQLTQTVSAALSHQDYPFAKLVEQLQPHRDPSHSPLFQAFFVLQKLPYLQTFLKDVDLTPFLTEPMSLLSSDPHACMQFGDLAVEPLFVPQQEGQFDLALELLDTGSALVGAFKYNLDLFDLTTIERMVGHFKTLLRVAIDHPDRPLRNLPMLTTGEQEQLQAWNDTWVNLPESCCIHHWIETQAQKTPQAIAVIWRDRSLTYGQLDDRSHHLACWLQTLDVQPETLVGICVARSLEMVIGLLAILKAGGAYVPLDPAYPPERLAAIMTDAEISVLLTQETLQPLFPDFAGSVVIVDAVLSGIPSPTKERVSIVQPHNLAYVIYTSGSTGQPKGVMIEHRQVINFFVGMDKSLQQEKPGTWLALTTLAFDISVLELLWTLTRGFQVVLQEDPKQLSSSGAGMASHDRPHPMQFSLFYFANEAETVAARDRYQLLLETAKFADAQGFTAIWTPERHFHEFGGIYPNPAVVGAALATVTQQIQIRAGSVVLPLHDELRIAEEWALVDNLSQGRVGISLASGWQPQDFVLAPHRYDDRHTLLAQGVETLRKLWRGETITRQDGRGNTIEVHTFPRPLQPHLPLWLTAAYNPDSFCLAGELGTHVLTHLLGQNLEELATKIDLYRQAWQQHHPEGTGHVTLMLHTFLGEDLETARSQVRDPLCRYLDRSLDLVLKMVEGLNLIPAGMSLKEADRETLLAYAFDRYFETSGLLGTPEKCSQMIEKLRAIGVDEIACLIDFGVDSELVMTSLNLLKDLKNQVNLVIDSSDIDSSDINSASYPVFYQLQTHQVSHLQCTPSWLRMVIAEPQGLTALQSLQVLLIGGEA
jgi:natural product biosynthesis luciferase-like monooxygenase protein